MNRASLSGTLRGGIATFSAQGVKFICQIASIAVLSRLLPAADFGMVGLMGSVLALLELFREFGLSTAIIQRETVNQSELNTLFKISIILGLVLMLTVIAAGLGMSWFFDEPRIKNISPFFGLMFFFQSLMTVPLALLRRQLKFGKLAIRDAVATIAGTAAGIIAALTGAGYYSLIIGPGVASLINLVLTWWAAKWVPRGPSASYGEVKPFLLFGGAFTAGEFANYLCQNMDNLLIGKVWGFQQLGYYSRSYSLMMAPTGQILGPIMAVLMPTMSRMRQNDAEYNSWCRTLARGAAWFAAPIAAFIAAASPEIVALLLGKGWEQSATILRWLSLIIYAKPMGSLIYLILLTSGEVKIMFNWVWVNALLTISAILIGLIYGPTGVATSLGIAGSLFGVPIAAVFATKTKIFRKKEFLMPYLEGGILGGICFMLFSALNWYIHSWGLVIFVHLCVLGIPLLIVMASAFFASRRKLVY